MKRLFVVLAIVLVFVVACDATPIEPEPTVSPLSAEEAQDQVGVDVAGVVEWLLGHIEEIALVAGLLVSLVSGGLEKARALAVSLMLEAEKVARDEVTMGGPEKMEMVMDRFVERLPADAKAVLRAVAAFRGQSLDGLVERLAQRWYDAAIND